VTDRYGEEDYSDNYKELWQITTKLSEILQTIDILLQHGIAPRIQTFIYKTNIEQFALY